MTFTKKFFYSAVFIALSLVPLADLLQPGLPQTHDGQDHVARIANFYQNLTEGNMIPRWAGNLNWGYGHPILIFLYPLPSYMSSLLHFLGFSFVDSIKLVFGLTYVLSGAAMYFWARNIIGEKAGILAGILYMYAPYRFVDLYVRGAIGEHVAFVFPPLLFYFLFKLSKKISWKYLVGGSFSLAGFILSHNAVSFMFIPVVVLYIFYLAYFAKNRIKLTTCYAALFVLGFGLSSFFWVPAFFEGKYTLRDIVTKGEYASRFVEFNKLIFGQWSYGITGQFTTQIGIAHWIMVLLAVPVIIILRKRRKNLWLLAVGIFVIFFFSLFVMNSVSQFVWETVRTLQKFQFPWRFLSLSVFASSVLGGIVFSVIAEKFKNIVFIIFIIIVYFVSKDYWHAKAFDQKPESFYTSVYDGTTDTGESSPIWSVRFMEKRPSANVEVIEKKAEVTQVKRSSVLRVYAINSSGKSRIKENTLYFPGWEVLIDGKKTLIEFQDPRHRGLITFFVEEGKHNVEIKFSETKLRLVSNIISLFSFIFLLILVILKPFNLWRAYQ